MAVGVRLFMAGVTQEQFDKVNALVDVDSNPPAGVIFHLSGPVEGGWGVTDVWESEADFEAFAPRVQAAIAGSGIEVQGPPEITHFEVHEHFPR